MSDGRAEGDDNRLRAADVLRSCADACDPDLPTPYRIDIGVSGLWDVTSRIWIAGRDEYVPNTFHIDP